MYVIVFSMNIYIHILHYITLYYITDYISYIYISLIRENIPKWPSHLGELRQLPFSPSLYPRTQLRSPLTPTKTHWLLHTKPLACTQCVKPLNSRLPQAWPHWGVPTLTRSGALHDQVMSSHQWSPLEASPSYWAISFPANKYPHVWCWRFCWS